MGVMAIPNIITILGPTATGKTKLAAELSYEFKGEVISADSRQVYIGMDIGTGKDLNDYIINNVKVPYHLIDIIRPEEEFNLFLFKTYFYNAFKDITSRGKTPFLAGGTGLYLSAVIQNYNLTKADFDFAETDFLRKKSISVLQNMLKKLNPKLHNTTDLLNKERIIKAIQIAKVKDADAVKQPKINSLNIGINPPRETIKERITKRLKFRLENGMIDEVKKMVDGGISFDRLDSFGLEYRFAGLYLKGELSYNDMFQKLNSAIHNFAKRQLTWFRKMEREGVKIYWQQSPDFDTAKDVVKNFYSFNF